MQERDMLKLDDGPASPILMKAGSYLRCMMDESNMRHISLKAPMAMMRRFGGGVKHNESNDVDETNCGERVHSFLIDVQHSV